MPSGDVLRAEAALESAKTAVRRLEESLAYSRDLESMRWDVTMILVELQRLQLGLIRRN